MKKLWTILAGVAILLGALSVTQVGRCADATVAGETTSAIDPLETWLLQAALRFSPPERHRQFEGYEETQEETRERYASIAHDIFEASEGKKNLAALMLAWAVGESGLYRDADLGPCYRQGAYKLRCDGGRAAGIWQLHEYVDRSAVPEGVTVTVADIFSDRARSARFVAKMLRRAMGSCRDLAPQDRLSAFGLGRCVAGNASVRARYELWRKVVGWAPRE